MDRVDVEIRAPRKRLTLEQRAARTTKMKTKKLLAQNPLLASELQPGGTLADWLPVQEQEQARIESITESFQDWQMRSRDFDEDMSDRALTLRDLVASRVSPDELARLDKKRQCYPPSPAYDHSHWYSTLREIDQAAASQVCEHGPEGHEGFRRYHDRCPRCWTPLERIIESEQPQQLRIGEQV